ncbi:MAG: response regulator, partial [Phycisphaeraceae bacterium]
MVTPDEPNLVVVVVEDDAETRANLCDILELDGLVVRSAGTFTECMAHKHGSPMAVILDCQLPDGTADQMIPHLKSAWPEAAIVVVTGYPDIDGAIACLRQGASDYLLKPVNPDALRSTVARIVEARRAAVTMRQRKAHLSSILNTAVDAIITIDHQGMITGTNPATESLFGYAR